MRRCAARHTRLIIEAPWLQFTSECQQFCHPPPLNNGWPAIGSGVSLRACVCLVTPTAASNGRVGAEREWGPRGDWNCVATQVTLHVFASDTATAAHETLTLTPSRADHSLSRLPGDFSSLNDAPCPPLISHGASIRQPFGAASLAAARPEGVFVLHAGVFADRLLTAERLVHRRAQPQSRAGRHATIWRRRR
jgi:hypothetical protein